MSRYSVFSTVTGKQLSILECSYEFLMGNLPDAAVYFEDVQFPFGTSIYDKDTHTVVSIGEAPYPHYVFDYAQKQWVDPRTVDELKKDKWLEIKKARSSMEFGGFIWDGSTFDSDATSQSRIQGVSQLATLALMNAQPFSIDWTLSGNSIRELSAQDMLAVGTAMGVHINTQHVKARLKRDMINAATTAEEIAAITW